ncbi:MAG: nitroreductase family protein [Marinifilaceae bacterium]
MGNSLIGINSETCIRCGHCVKVCPAYIFKQDDTSKLITACHEESCIGCGHCVDCCPQNAIEHKDFPAHTVHSIDYNELPSPNQVELLCRVRRSNRAFTKKPVPRDMIERILEAAHRAPTASNKQTVSFTVVTNKDVLDKVSRFTLDVFGGVAKKLENPFLRPVLSRALPEVYAYLPVFHRLMDEYKLGKDLILRGAPAAIFIHTPSDSKFGSQDSNLAYQNGSLMAEALGVSQFYLGFVCSAQKQAGKGALEKLLGIDGTIHAAMALGMPAFRFPNYTDRKSINVNFIE